MVRLTFICFPLIRNQCHLLPDDSVLKIVFHVVLSFFFFSGCFRWEGKFSPFLFILATYSFLFILIIQYQSGYWADLYGLFNPSAPLSSSHSSCLEIWDTGTFYRILGRDQYHLCITQKLPNKIVTSEQRKFKFWFCYLLAVASMCLC